MNPTWISPFFWHSKRWTNRCHGTHWLVTYLQICMTKMHLKCNPTPKLAMKVLLAITKTCSLLSFVRSIYNPTYRCEWYMHITRGNAIGRCINWLWNACLCCVGQILNGLSLMHVGIQRPFSISLFSYPFLKLPRCTHNKRSCMTHRFYMHFTASKVLICECPSGPFWALTLTISSL